MSMLGAVVDDVLTLHGPAAYAVVGSLTFAEAAILVGFVLPGETAVLLGGVLAHGHHVALPAIAVTAVAAAILGDSVGYEVGRRFGPQLLGSRLFSRHRQALQRGEEVLRTKGGRAVFFARFTVFLRAVMPGMAGAARMPYQRFLAFNAAGGTVWALGLTLLGFLAGSQLHTVENIAGRASIGMLVALAAGTLFMVTRHRRAEHDT